MANIKSAIKTIRRISRQTKVNKFRKSRFKNAIKKMNVLIEKKNNLLTRLIWAVISPRVMANTKSAIKTTRRISRETKFNRLRKSRFRNAIKKMNALIEKKK